ncbi:hypothetical protein BDY24DRAFT_372186 [Mrakia frigida]|uniref:uncharacterized protein n=1 Tax=Mrakia frigida TaxID=29902 RepID=UPI003FCC1C2D
MLPIVASLFLALCLASTSQAATFVNNFPVGRISTHYAGNLGGRSFSMKYTELACQQQTEAVGGVGYYWSSSGSGSCNSFTSYPPVCSQYGTYANIWRAGFIDRCSSAPGYVLAADGTCIYTGGTGLTDAQYAFACPSKNNANPSAVPAPFKRAVKEQNIFIGGKICPIGEQACPLGKGFDCVDIKENLNSCGGCAGGTGVDCSDIIGVSEVACVAGSCVVDSCVRGFDLSPAGQCIKK